MGEHEKFFFLGGHGWKKKMDEHEWKKIIIFWESTNPKKYSFLMSINEKNL